MMKLFLLFLFSLSMINFSSLSARADDTRRDVHSYSHPELVRVNHLDLTWDVLFESKILRGIAILEVEKIVPGNHPLVLDTRDLTITIVETSLDGQHFTRTNFQLGTADKILGAPLTIELPEKIKQVRVEYQTSPRASGLQWLDPSQTAGKRQPFLFTQSEAIHARSWIPCQDSPQVRVTYSAHVHTPPGLRAVMSAENNSQVSANGRYDFVMDQPIASYLIALAVGDLAFRPTGKRTGVYAEPSVVEDAAREFADTEKMVSTAESLVGPYRWKRYDLLVLPPSFPFGGMENPKLTFVTPTVIAGDKSLVSLVAHELAHSWSGNLVTNATWRDFWLNEGITVYLERRILEAVYGRGREEMEATLGRQTLEEEMATLEPRDQILHVDLNGRDPDAGFTNVPYEKGALFLRQMEETFGRQEFDKFLRAYFDHFAFQSITTDDFISFLKANLFAKHPQQASHIPLQAWITHAGLPTSAPRPASDAFAKIEQQAHGWLSGQTPAQQLSVAKWSTQEWLHFLKFVGAKLDLPRMKELDDAFKLSNIGNSEIAFQWLLTSIRLKYEPAYPRLREYLTTIGRRKLVKPLYEELVKTPEGKKMAQEIYQQARPTYHPITVTTIDTIVPMDK